MPAEISAPLKLNVRNSNVSERGEKRAGGGVGGLSWLPEDIDSKTKPCLILYRKELGTVYEAENGASDGSIWREPSNVNNKFSPIGLRFCI